MKHFLIHIITTLFIIIFAQLFFIAKAEDSYSCENSIRVSQGTKTSGFYRNGGDINVTFTLITSKNNNEIPIDLTFAYDKNRSPGNWYINEKVISISQVENKQVTLTIPKSYFIDSGTTVFEAGIFPNPDCNQDDLFSCRESIKKMNREECIQRIDVFAIDPGVDAPMEGNCLVNNEPQNRFSCYRTNNPQTENIEWSQISGMYEDFTKNCPDDRVQDVVHSCNASLATYGNAGEWCVKCPSERTSGVPDVNVTVITKAGELCNDTSLKCLENVLECKTISSSYNGANLLETKKCVYKEFGAQSEQYCVVGSKQCSDGLICLGNDKTNNVNNYKLGSEGVCMSSSGNDKLNKLSCNSSVPSSCNQYLNQLPGYRVARCMGDGFCAFEADLNGEIARMNQGSEGPSVAPIVPAPPSRFIEKCDGNLSCANCVARQESGGVFGSYQDAADAEFEYNKKVDEWKQARLDGGTYETAPTTKEYQFVYTGYIYTSLGCIDTTDNGLITRVVQIALGIIGGVILVRFLQAGMKLQGGGSPEDQAEAVEIITSAIVALLLFVMSMIVLRFIGFDVFQIFSPGTFQMS